MDPFQKRKAKDIENADTILSFAREQLNKKKKPVKFTWNGLFNLGIQLTGPSSPFSPLRQKRLQELSEGNKANEKDYIDFFEDIEKAFAGGIQDLGYGIEDVLTTGIAGLTDNPKLLEDLDEYYKKNKVADPETLTGGIVKILTQYGVPGGAAFKLLGRLKIFQRSRKLAETGTKLQKGTQIAKRVGYMATASAATDFIATEPDRETFFVQEEKTDDLTGDDLIAARFRNRLRFGAEGALLGGGFSLIGKPVALGFKYGIFKPAGKVAGLGLKGIDKAVVTPLTYLGSRAIPTPVAKKIRNASAYTVNKALSTVLTGKPNKQLPEFSEWRLFSETSRDPLKRKLKKIDQFLARFRSVGKQTGLGYQISSEARREIKAQSRTIEKYLESIEKKSYNLAKDFETKYNTKTSSEASQKYYLDQVLAFLKGNLKLNALPSELKGSASALQKELSLIKKNFADLLPEKDLKDFILKNLNTYMRRCC